MYFLLSFLLFVTSIAVCLVYSYQMVYAMILGYVLLAAAAMRLGVPLVSHDGIFEGAPGLKCITAIGDE